jgi:hypothetical protein
VVLRYYALSPRTRVGGVELAARLGWRFGWETRYYKRDTDTAWYTTLTQEEIKKRAKNGHRTELLQ